MELFNVANVLAFAFASVAAVGALYAIRAARMTNGLRNTLVALSDDLVALQDSVETNRTMVKKLISREYKRGRNEEPEIPNAAADPSAWKRAMRARAALKGVSE
jgi:hypothetical protein